MTQSTFNEQVVQNLGVKPTNDQLSCLHDITKYLAKRHDRAIHILNGYAGTGKTTLVAAIVRTLTDSNVNVVLMAPTGRAAKVLSEQCHHPAFTIHKFIYNTFQDEAGDYRIMLSKRSKKNTIYFIDEASMIPSGNGNDVGSFAMRNILDDIISFVFMKENCKLIFIGDTAQLPPVGEIQSTALNPTMLGNMYQFDVTMSTLKEVVRQIETSPILQNATFIRNKLTQRQFTLPYFTTIDTESFRPIDNNELTDTLGDYFNQHDNKSIVICRYNKQANIYNNAIRTNIFLYDSILVKGEKLVVVKNNYYWKIDQDNSFIANGELLEVEKVHRIEMLYGFTFAHVTVSLVDYADAGTFDAILLLDTLNVEGASLPYDRKSVLYYNIFADLPEHLSKKEKNTLVRNNPYFNALQVKYGYAVTCHKAQGGQWDNVFIDKGYSNADVLDEEFFRWLYTAVTRGVEKEFLINF